MDYGEKVDITGKCEEKKRWKRGDGEGGRMRGGRREEQIWDTQQPEEKVVCTLTFHLTTPIRAWSLMFMAFLYLCCNLIPQLHYYFFNWRKSSINQLQKFVFQIRWSIERDSILNRKMYNVKWNINIEADIFIVFWSLHQIILFICL